MRDNAERRSELLTYVERGTPVGCRSVDASFGSFLGHAGAEPVRPAGTSQSSVDLLRLGMAAWLRGDSRSAIHHWRSAQCAPYFQNRGNCCRSTGSSQALEWYRLALAVDPLSSQTWYDLGIFLEKDGSSVEALEAFEHAIRADTDWQSPRYHFIAGFQAAKLSRESGAFAKAVAYSEWAFCDPERVSAAGLNELQWAYFVWMESLIGTGDHDNAVRVASSALSHLPEGFELESYFRGRIEQLSGSHD